MQDNSERFRLLKSDLKIVIDQTQILPGSLVVIRPRDGVGKLDEDYCEWLATNIVELLPPGTRAMICNGDPFDIKNIECNHKSLGRDLDQIYERGWYDALRALEEAVS